MYQTVFKLKLKRKLKIVLAHLKQTGAFMRFWQAAVAQAFRRIVSLIQVFLGDHVHAALVAHHAECVNGDGVSR